MSLPDSSVKGSIEYAVEHLKVPCILVLGHTGYGAVKARLDGVKEGEIGKLVSHIRQCADDGVGVPWPSTWGPC